MAGPGSRLEKFGTVFSRVRGLIKSGALKPNEKPIWYDIYAAHPPAVDPTMSRALPTKEVVDIVYIEDLLRAKFYQKYGNGDDPIDLADPTTNTVCQRFIEKYMEVEKSGIERGQLFQAVEETLKSEGVRLLTIQEQKNARREQNMYTTTVPGQGQTMTISEAIQRNDKDYDKDMDYSSSSSSDDDSSSSSDSSSDEDRNR